MLLTEPEFEGTLFALLISLDCNIVHCTKDTYIEIYIYIKHSVNIRDVVDFTNGKKECHTCATVQLFNDMHLCTANKTIMI